MTPVRATYRDVSRKVFVQYASRPFEFGINGHALNQIEKGARELFLAGIALPEAIRLLRSLPGSAGQVHACDGEYQSCLLILWSYIGRGMASGGWDWTAVDRLYSHDEKILSIVHDFVLAHGTPTTIGLTPDMLDLLDLRIVGSKLADVASWTLAPAGLPDPVVGDLAMVSTKITLPALTSQQAMLLSDVIIAHETHSGVQAAMLQFEASARTLRELHLFRIADFTGYNDGYDAADLAVLEAQQDRLMRGWAAGFTAHHGAPDWRVIMMHSLDHAMLHKAQNLRGLTFEFGLSQFNPDGTMAPPGTWPVKDAADWIQFFA
jgi:hypothetical protein